jgi:hypothetical protein
MARSKGLVVLFLVGAVEAGTSRGMRRKEGAARVDMVAGVVCHAWQRRMGWDVCLVGSVIGFIAGERRL